MICLGLARMHVRQRRAAELKPGQLFGFLKVLGKLPAKGKNSMYAVECVALSRGGGRFECGKIKEISRCQLVSGDTQSCGCMKGVLWKAAIGRLEGELAKFPEPQALSLQGLPLKPIVPRVRGSRLRCPLCLKSRALKEVTALHGEEFIRVGRHCVYCNKLVAVPGPVVVDQEYDSPIVPISTR